MGISDDISPKNKKNNIAIRISSGAINSGEETNKHSELDKNKSLSDEFFKPNTNSKSLDKESSSTADLSNGKLNNFVHTLDKRYLWLLLIPIIAIVLLQNFSSIRNVLSKKDSSTNSNVSSDGKVYNGEIIPQDYTTGDATNQNINSNTAAPTVTPTPTPTTQQNSNTPATINKAAIKIKVLNGNGISKSAAAIKSELVKGGFKVALVTNADNFKYPTTKIYYKTGDQAEATLARTALTSRSATIEQSDSIAGTYDLVVLVGKN